MKMMQCLAVTVVFTCLSCDMNKEQITALNQVSEFKSQEIKSLKNTNGILEEQVEALQKKADLYAANEALYKDALVKKETADNIAMSVSKRSVNWVKERKKHEQTVMASDTPPLTASLVHQFHKFEDSPDSAKLRIFESHTTPAAAVDATVDDAGLWIYVTNAGYEKNSIPNLMQDEARWRLPETLNVSEILELERIENGVHVVASQSYRDDITVPGAVEIDFEVEFRVIDDFLSRQLLVREISRKKDAKKIKKALLRAKRRKK